MALLLNIDTATSYGAVAVSNNGLVISIAENYSQKEHASFLHSAIAEVLSKSGILPVAIDAIAVTIGPGSYTGLRVGLSAAKGLCYAMQKPIIAISTLQSIAQAASTEPLPLIDKPVLYIPMIDARRMEVFTAAYNSLNELHIDPAAVILDDQFLADVRSNYFLVFAGDGSRKLQQLLPIGDYFFSNALHSIEQVAQIGEKRFQENMFEDVAYCEPLYLKPFISTSFVKK